MELYPHPNDKATQAQKDYLISLTKEKFKLHGDITLSNILETIGNHLKENVSSFEYLDKKTASRWIKELINLPK